MKFYNVLFFLTVEDIVLLFLKEHNNFPTEFTRELIEYSIVPISA